jgi:hypothetical protein
VKKTRRVEVKFSRFGFLSCSRRSSFPAHRGNEAKPSGPASVGPRSSLIVSIDPPKAVDIDNNLPFNITLGSPCPLPFQRISFNMAPATFSPNPCFPPVAGPSPLFHRSQSSEVFTHSGSFSMIPSRRYYSTISPRTLYPRRPPRPPWPHPASYQCSLRTCASATFQRLVVYCLTSRVRRPGASGP